MAPLLSVEGVSKEFQVRGKKVLALDSLTLAVNEAEFVTVVGPSGCGKSTLLNLIVGLLSVSSGHIFFRNRPINGINPEIGYITQKDNLLPWRTLVQNVEIALEIRGTNKGERRERAEELIERVGLKGFEDHYPHELSGGMRQRANIIRTLIYDPELILMDEPFGPLDAQTRIVLQEQPLSLWSTTKKTIILITHDLVEATTGRVFLNLGRQTRNVRVGVNRCLVVRFSRSLGPLWSLRELSGPCRDPSSIIADRNSPPCLKGFWRGSKTSSKHPTVRSSSIPAPAPGLGRPA